MRRSLTKNLQKNSINMEITINQADVTYGDCRCCASKGYHRDLLTEYEYNGVSEIYSEIFMECFNITLSIHNSSRLICEGCVNRLRDASNFRDMVVAVECQLLDPLRKGGCEFAQVSEITVDIKKEEVKEEYCSDDDMLTENFSYDMITDDYTPDPEPRTPSPADCKTFVPGEAELVARYPLTSLRLPRIPESFLKYCRELRGKIITAKDIEKLLQQESEHTNRLNNQAVYYTEKKGLILNTATILECSNVTPFKSRTTHGFPCFYCRKAIDNLQQLKEHVNKEHSKTDLRKMLWKCHGAESLVVNVDVTDLKCTLCGKDIPNLNELKKHLIQVHNKELCTQFTDRVIPFKLDKNYECQICGCNFETFGSVERHMNVHFRNYVCKDCGVGFATKYRLKVHIKSIHVDGSYTCNICEKEFTTYQKKKTHVDSVHKLVKRFKCPKCSERFTEYFARQRHLVSSHGAEPIKYKCNVCDREFDRRYYLSRHLKKDHLKEKDMECEICGYKCFTTTELKVHMIKHGGERTHECAVCKKAYARKKTLKEHMKIHTNDRRHACAVCGQAFIQKCSLKGHIKTHHPEIME